MAIVEIDPTIRKNIQRGMYVVIEEEKTNEIYKGLVSIILSHSNNQRGIKVELTNGKIGYIQEIYTIEQIKLENFKFYNRFLFEKKLYSIWDNKKKEYLCIDYHYHTVEDSYLTVFISKDKDDLRKILKELKLSEKNYKIKDINNNTCIHSQFRTNYDDIQMILLNNEKYLRFKSFINIENDIRQKSKMK